MLLLFAPVPCIHSLCSPIMADEQVPAQAAVQQAQALLQPAQPPVAGPNTPVEPNPSPLQLYNFSFFLVLFLLFRLFWLASPPRYSPRSVYILSLVFPRFIFSLLFFSNFSSYASTRLAGCSVRTVMLFSLLR